MCFKIALKVAQYLYDNLPKNRLKNSSMWSHLSVVLEIKVGHKLRYSDSAEQNVLENQLERKLGQKGWCCISDTYLVPLDESKTDSCDERFRHKHKFGTKNRYFLEEIYISEKLRNWKKFALYSLLGPRHENIAIFKQTILSKRFIAFKMAFSCCFV